jgi:CDP-diacylglycerol--glycerol-3-phosphate 3-phosphatidyltransferase
MIEGLKPFYNSALRPIAVLCSKANLHPHAISIAGIVISFVAAYFCALGPWLYAAVLVSCAGCFDGLDGLVARQTGKQTRFGAVLDSTGDRVTEAAWLFGLIVFYALHQKNGYAGIYLAFLAQAGSQMVSYVRARCEGVGIACSAGILQRSERIIVIIVCLLLGPSVMKWGLGFIAGLGFLTAAQRLWLAYRSVGAR